MNLFTTSISGLVAAQNRLNASASNIANQQSTTQQIDGEIINEPYQPIETVETANPNGGVNSTFRADSSQPLLRFDPNSPLANEEGFVAQPNVDVAGETVEQILATQAFLANLSTIERADDALGQLLDSTE